MMDAESSSGAPTDRMGDTWRGLLAGLLIGEGSFGGDGRQAQVTLRMHARHEDLFRSLVKAVPGSRLYGPYHHGGRHYLQWMIRGQALRSLLGELEGLLALDGYAAARCAEMRERYGV